MSLASGNTQSSSTAGEFRRKTRSRTRKQVIRIGQHVVEDTVQRNDLSPARRKTRNVIAAPIPPKIVKNAIDRVHHVPAWLDTAFFAIHMLVGTILWAGIVLSNFAGHQGFLALVTVSAYLLAIVALNSHFPTSMRRWCMAGSDIALIVCLRLFGDFTLVSDPNTTSVILLATVCVVFTAYLDPMLSRFTAFTSVGLGQLLLLPYIVPSIFEPLLNANLLHTWPLESLLLLTALVMTACSTLIIVSTYRKWQLSKATMFLERVQIALATKRQLD